MRFNVYWWAKIGGKRKKYGHDTIEVEEDELLDFEADEMLESVAMGEVNSPFTNFEKYYPLADFPEDFGVVKIVKAK